MSFMKPTQLVSHKIVTEFGPRLTAILSSAPRQLEILPFTPKLQVTPAQLESIEAAYYSRDIWEGTVKSALSPAAGVFWNIVEHFDQVQALSALDTLLPGCDWLILACPLVPETRNLLDARRLALLPRTAGLINIARGEIIDEAALTDALSDGRLHCAYLDVFTVEPLAPESPLWGLPNVLISPHNAGASAGTYARGVEIFLGNLGCYLAGQALKNETPRA